MKPWRQIACPHKDVLEGTFKQSEFAADISAVANKTASPEYQNAEMFFSRTYITEGMRNLLVSVAERLCQKGGDPVIQLQTNFGGGKTHTLLAVYHLATSGVAPAKLAGISEILDRVGVSKLPPAKVAVLDGIALSPNQPLKLGGLTIRTIWGLLAYRLFGAEGYAMVADSDAAGTAPGKEVVTELLRRAAPCVILMDELVAFYRQLDNTQKLTAGSFEANMSFIQVLTESVKMVPNAVLLASLPESDTEVAGSFGKTTLLSLEKCFGRLENVWKPVAADEAFAIVRRRLFESIGDTAEMEEVCNAFVEYYRKNRDKFPNETQESQYAERLRQSYPIHPEVFDRLYQDWSTLPNFQRTRGVLQYMAIIIHRLWIDNDQDPLIMPGSMPLADATVRNKSTHYLPQGWDPVIEKEIDGANSIPAEIDGKDQRFGAVLAARRAARTIFLGSAPSAVVPGATRGINVERILLGCAIPGHSLGIYEDVLKRLRDRLHYLFADIDRFWYDTRPNLRREMESRQEHIEGGVFRKAMREVTTRICGNTPFFAGVHVFTPHADIPDDIADGIRLVVLEPSSYTAYTASASKATYNLVSDILKHRGEQSRLHQNRLVFLAPDNNNLSLANDLCRVVLAWKEIIGDIDAGRLNLDTYQVKQAKKERAAAENALDQAVRDCYHWLLVPMKTDDGTGINPVRINAVLGSNLANAVEKTLLNEELVIFKWSPMGLKRHLERYYLKDGVTEIPVRKVWEDLCNYCSMPRLTKESVLANAISEGVSKGDFFGYAQGKDGEKYLGFAYGEPIDLFSLSLDENALLIASGAAAEIKRKIQPVVPPAPTGAPRPTGVATGNVSPNASAEKDNRPGGAVAKAVYNRFFASADLEPLKAMLQFNSIMENLITHFNSKTGIKINLHLDIEVSSDNPFADSLVRTVQENKDTLKLGGEGFCNE